jgi:hypothetical protein
MPFFSQREAERALGKVLADFEPEPEPKLIISSANGTFIDRAESAALAPYDAVHALYPKRSFGEAPGASALLQVVLAAVALEKLDLACACVPVIGWNQQAGAVRITRAE